LRIERYSRGAQGNGRSGKRLIARINGTYIRRRECELRETNVQQRIDALAAEVRRKPG